MHFLDEFGVKSGPVLQIVMAWSMVNGGEMKCKHARQDTDMPSALASLVNGPILV